MTTAVPTIEQFIDEQLADIRRWQAEELEQGRQQLEALGVDEAQIVGLLAYARDMHLGQAALVERTLLQQLDAIDMH